MRLMDPNPWENEGTMRLMDPNLRVYLRWCTYWVYLRVYLRVVYIQRGVPRVYLRVVGIYREVYLGLYLRVVYIQGVSLPTMPLPTMVGIHASPLYHPVPPWVYPYIHQCPAVYRVPHSVYPAVCNRALGSKEEKPVGERRREG